MIDTGKNTQSSDIKIDSWFQTYSGIRFYPWRPTEDMFCVEDITHHCALANRWAGATRFPISVAYHQIMAHDLAKIWYPDSLEIQVWCLMHDAGEAYVQDVIRPIKQFMPEFSSLEDNILEVLARKFKLPWPVPEEVWLIDHLQLAIENVAAVRNPVPGLYEDLFAKHLEKTGGTWTKIEDLHWAEAEAWYLNRMRQVGLA